MPSFFDLQKFAHTGIAAPDMTAFDKARALAAFGGKTQTLTGVPPLSFPSNGSPITVWSMKGNGQQSGTPSPQSIIMPTFCGVRTANLFDESTIEVGGISVSTGLDTDDPNRRRSGFIPVESSTEYSITREITGVGSFFWLIGYDENQIIVDDSQVYPTYPGALIRGSDLTLNKWTFTTTPTTKYVRWYVTANNSYSNIMFNSGSTALPYEPYGWAEKITCDGQTVPVYLGQTQTVRKIRKFVLTGEESMTLYTVSTGNLFRIDLPTLRIQSQFANAGMCTHYRKVVAEADRVNGTISGGNAATVQGVVDIVDDYATVADFKTYLAEQYAAGTPVTVWYVLAEPQTAIINEPLCKIGDYADELHSEDAGVTIPTAKGQNTLTVESELQPSEMTITYFEEV